MLVEADDPFVHANMAELSHASALVVRGTVTEAETDVHVGDRRLRYVAFTVDVDETLAGTPGDSVRVLMSSHIGDQPITMEGRPLPQVGDQGVWFLNPVAPELGFDGYVLTGQSGLLLLDGDEVVGGGAPGASAIAAEVDRLGSPDAVIDHVRAVAD